MSAIIPGAIGVIGAIAGSIVTGEYQIRRTKAQQSSENKRRHAEIYADKKVQALSDLNQSMVDFHQTYRHLEDADTDQSSYREPNEEMYRNGIQQEHQNFIRILNRAVIFLNEGQTESLRRLSHYMSKIDEDMHLRFIDGVSEPEGVNKFNFDDWEDYNRLRKEAQNILREEIAQPVNNFEDSVA